MIKAVIFDWGGVLIDDLLPNRDYLISQAIKIDQNLVSQHLRDFEKLLLTDKIAEDSIWNFYKTKYNARIPKVQSLWLNIINKSYKEKKEMFVLIDLLKRSGYKIGLISNTEKTAVANFKRKSFKNFDVGVFSCVEKIAKPDKKIFQLALNRLGVKANEAIFIDDNPKYLTGAHELGIKSILFNNFIQLKKDLSKFIKI